MAEKDVITQHQAGVAACDMLLGQEEGLRQAFWPGLYHIGNGATPLPPVMEQGLVQGQVLRCGDEADIPDAGHHQGG